MTGGRRGRRRGGGGQEAAHDGPDERWMASYLDMITVMMCLFLVLYAMSAVDQQKFDALRDSLATGFGQERVDDAGPETAGLVLPEEMSDPDGGAADVTPLADAAKKEVARLEELRDRISAALEAGGLRENVQLTIDERGLTVGLVGAETFFATARNDLSERAVAVLNRIGPVLSDSSSQISVEGHADNRPMNGSGYETNWELSSGRSTEVLRFFVERAGIPGNRIQAIGFGDSRPTAVGNDPASLAQNRRVDIVALSSEDEAVRALIPQVLAAGD